MFPTIIMGVGGSGIRTLLEVNKILSGDRESRINISRSIYYIAVDTDEAGLHTFRDEIKAQVGEDLAPNIHTILISSEYTSIEPYVKKYFIDPYKGDLIPEQKIAKERMYANWWAHPRFGLFMDRPIVYRKYRGPACHPVVFFLAWKDLEKIGEEFERIIDAICARQFGFPEGNSFGGKPQLNGLRVYIISSLAGGTGRGVWHLLALKLRESFSRRGEHPPFIGFFFDSSLYKNIMRIGYQLEIGLKHRSMTGISELSCFVRRSVESLDGSLEYSFALPSMKNPLGHDSLNVNLNLVSSSGNAIDEVFLFFDRGPVGILSGRAQGFQVAGGVIYALIKRRELGAVDINSGVPFWGGASAFFEVDIFSLRAFYESMAKIKVLDVLQKRDKKSVQKAVKGVLEAFKFERYWGSVLAPEEFEENGKLGPNLQGSFLQRVNYFLVEENKNILDLLIETVLSQKKDEAIEIAREVDLADTERVDSAFQKTMGNVFCGKTPSQLVQKGEEELFNSTGSLVDILEFRRAISKILKEEIEEFPEEEKNFRKISVKKTVEEFSSGESRGGIFSQEAIRKIVQTAMKKILLAGFYLVRLKYLELLKEILAENERKISIYMEILERIKRLRVNFERGPSQFNCAGNAFGGWFEHLFTDPEEPEKAIRETVFDMRYFKKYLKPPMARNKVLDLLDISPSLDVVGFLKNSLKGLGLSSDNKEIRVESFMADLEKVIERNSTLPFDFLEENFSIISVIERLRDVWEKRFNAIKKDKYKLHEVALLFESFFGVPISFDQDGNVILPEMGEFLGKMAIFLGARCLPYWDVANAEILESHLDVFLPWSKNEAPGPNDVEEEIKAFLRSGQERDKVSVEVFYLKDRGAEKGKDGGAFFMAVFVRQGVGSLKHINSLNYWKEDSKLIELLNKSEIETGEILFDDEDAPFRLGFVSPVFVRDPLRSLRWRPWVNAKGKRASEEC